MRNLDFPMNLQKIEICQINTFKKLSIYIKMILR